MSDESVRVWRAASESRVLLMAGRTARYRIEPRGEYVFGVVEEAPMRSVRGREHRVAGPGQLVAWDPSQAHAGRAADGRPWASRLMVIELPDLHDLADDPEADPLGDVAFPTPVISDARLAKAFVELHTALSAASTKLETDERLAGWLRLVADEWSQSRRPPRPTRRGEDLALRRALDYLGDEAARNVGLDELAAAAGISKFRLVRLVRERTGLPPHALQLAHRLGRARRLLEAGETIAATSMATGFSDQSHLHRHFRRSLGMTPAQYQRRVRGPLGPT